MRTSLRLTAVAAVCALLTSGCSLWAQDRFGPDHTGSNPLETILTPANVGSLTTQWSGVGDPDSTPVLAGHTLFLPGAALNATTGALLWTSDGLTPLSPAWAGGLVYEVEYVLHSSVLEARDAKTGSFVWDSIGSGNQVFYGLPTLDRTVANGVVYIDRTDGKLLALNAATGAVLWTTTIGTSSLGEVALSRGIVYAGSARELSAVNAATGEVLWSSPTGENISSSPAVAGGMVYVRTTGKVYAFDAATGAPVWDAAAGAAGASRDNLSSPAIADGFVYVGSADHNVYALNAATGATTWTAVTGGAVDASPSVANGVVYVHSEDGKVYALNGATGVSLWSHTIGAGTSSPAISEGVLYVGGGSSEYAFALPVSP